MMAGEASIQVRAVLAGEDMHLIEHAEITWDRGTFTAIDEARASTREINALAIPTFINAHVHSGDSFMKDAGFHLSLERLVAPPDGLKHELLARAPPSTIVEGMRQAGREMARAGTRAFVDFREGGVAGAELLLEAARSFPVDDMPRILVRPGDEPGSIDALLRVARDTPAITGFNTSTPGGCSDQQLEAIARACKAGVHGRPLIFGTHAGETARNAGKCQAVHGEPDIQRALRYFGDRGRACMLVHCNHVDETAIRLVNDTGASVVFCPGTAMTFSNIPDQAPYKALMESGATCALGTDNVMINAPDMFQAMNAFTRLLKMKHQGWAFDPAHILEMATINPARMLEIDKAAGSIDPGKEASFTLLDTAHPAFHGTMNLALAVLLRAHPGHVIGSWARGKPIHGGAGP